MNEAVLIHVMLTYLRGRFELVSQENERYRLTAGDIDRLLVYFDLMEPWTRSTEKSIAVGPYEARVHSVCEIRIPLELADGQTRHVPVPIEWLRRMRPLMTRALELVAHPPDIGPDFSLEYDADGGIAVLPPDRTTLRPADPPPG